jgi:hypothetical protein
MPKGVEHIGRVMNPSRSRSARTSWMPKGVEHALTEHPELKALFARTSRMPKGVQHIGELVAQRRRRSVRHCTSRSRPSQWRRDAGIAPRVTDSSILRGCLEF